MDLTIPTIKVFCLPVLEQNELKSLHQNIVKVMSGFPRTGVRGEEDLLVLFPPDLMAYGLGQEIKVEITDLPENARRNLNLLAQKMCMIMKFRFPQARIFCKVKCIEPEAGVWSLA